MEINLNKALSTEQAILRVMETPQGKGLALACYYEWDIHDAYERFLQSEEWQAVISLLAKFPPPSKAAMDLGAGNGIGSYALTTCGYSVVALEPDPSELVGYGGIQKFKSTLPVDISPVSGFGECLPFENKSFGLVYVRQALHHSTNLNQTMKEISRILQPGGIVIATREHLIDDDASLQLFLKNHALQKYTHAESAHTLQEYKSSLKNSNLKLIRLLLSKDSVINHYPTSNTEVHDKFYKTLQSKFGKAGTRLSENRALEKIYRRILSTRDHNPGRMISFVAKSTK